MHGKTNLGQLGYEPSLENDSRLVGKLMFAIFKAFSDDTVCLSFFFFFSKKENIMSPQEDDFNWVVVIQT